ncbi:MAG TPA: FAD-binding oxidoreductase [Pseudonocardiaceae bacterium]|nr:FAD-binding oxidoreductase [Pseudonocardiaceae bacterium]
MTATHDLAGFQLASPHRPAVVVDASTADDVVAAVREAAEGGQAVGVQATGHGRSVAIDGGVLINTAGMAQVSVDPDTRVARAEAGARWGDVVAAAAKHGLAPLNGSAPTVGVVGYTLGGGLGLLARQYGYAADHVRAVEIVTADGQERRVTATEDADLFWALRGAGANFGVVTAIEIDLVPLDRLYGGTLIFDTDQIPAVIDAYRTWTRTVPEQLTSSLITLPMPDIPQIPEPIRGRFVARVHVAYTGDAATGEQLVEPLRAVGPRLIDSLGDLPYTESHTIYNEPTMPHAYIGDNRRLRELDPAMLNEIFAISGPDAPVMCVVDIRHLGAAASREPGVPNAVHRDDSPYLLRILSPFSAEDADQVAEVHRRFFAAAQPWATGRALNFVYRPGASATETELREIYGDAGYDRLRALKARYDPANLFRINHNIVP